MSRTDVWIRGLAALTVVALGAVAAVISFRHAYAVMVANGADAVSAVLTPLTIDGMVLVSGLVLLDSARRCQKAPVLAVLTLSLGVVATLGVNAIYGLAHGFLGALVAGWPALALVLSVELLMGMIRRGQTSLTGYGIPSRSLTDFEVSTGRSLVEDEGEKGIRPVDTPKTDGVSSTDVIDEDEKGTREVSPPGGEPGVRVPEVMHLHHLPYPEPSPHQVRAAEVFAEEIEAGEVPSLRRIKRTLRVGQPRAEQVRAYLATLQAQPAGGCSGSAT